MKKNTTLKSGHAGDKKCGMMRAAVHAAFMVVAVIPFIVQGAEAPAGAEARARSLVAQMTLDFNLSVAQANLTAEPWRSPAGI